MSAKNPNRPFPIQREKHSTGVWGAQPKSTIPMFIKYMKLEWWLAEEAHNAYAEQHGDDITLEQIAERGGFSRVELLEWLQ